MDIVELAFYDLHELSLSFSDIKKYRNSAGLLPFGISDISKNLMNVWIDWIDVIYVYKRSTR